MKWTYIYLLPLPPFVRTVPPSCNQRLAIFQSQKCAPERESVSRRSLSIVATRSTVWIEPPALIAKLASATTGHMIAPCCGGGATHHVFANAKAIRFNVRFSDCMRFSQSIIHEQLHGQNGSSRSRKACAAYHLFFRSYCCT